MGQKGTGSGDKPHRLRIVSHSDVETVETPLAPLPFHPQKEILDTVDGLYFIASQLSKDPGLAADLVQETCHKAWRAWPSLRSAYSFKAWLFSILHRTLRRHKLRAGRLAKDVPLEDCLRQEDSRCPATTTEADPATRAILDPASFRTLPRTLKETAILVDIERFTLPEVSMILAVPLSTVASRLTRAHMALQAPLAKAAETGLVTSTSLDSRCQWTRRLMLLGRGEEKPATEHMQECERCRAFLVREEEISEWLRVQIPKDRAPHIVRERVKQLLATQATWGGSATLAAIPWPWVMVVIVLTAAVAFFLFLGQMGRVEAERILDQVSRDHMALSAATDRAEFVSASPEQVEDWIRERLQLAIHLPRLSDSRLLGARLTRPGNRATVIVFFDLEPERPPPTHIVSLHMFEEGGEDWAALGNGDSADKSGFRRIHHRGVNVWVWNRLGITYLLASQLGDRALQERMAPP